ncbi:MAG: hypothetical protein IJJ33_06000 [Victivallales bacterium]|nr:hypothetical protein [Victivallales bacterium]
MCVWSAYAGKQEAAPLLWDSLTRIEGIWGGFYTGLVTMDVAGLHWEKCVGCTEVWQKRFQLKDFPGCAGLIHSRTLSGGDAHRAHPFVGADGIVALVSQGSSGLFKDNTPAFTDCANAMLARGRKCRSAIPEDAMRSFLLTDGTRASMSDIVANAVEEQYLEHGDPVRAMKTVCASLPEESATIFLFRDRPDFIGFVNVNQHLVCDFEEDSVWLSVTSLGVPGYAMEIAGNSVGFVTAKGEFHRERLAEDYPAIDTRIPPKALPAFRSAIRENPGLTLGKLCDLGIRPLFPHTTLEYCAITAYSMLETLAQAGEIRFEPTLVPGWEGVPGRIFRIYSAE